MSTQAGNSKKPIGVIVAAVLVVASLIAAMLFLSKGMEKENEVSLEEPPTEEEIAEMDIKPLEGDLVVESVGLATSLKEMSLVNNVINPPGFDSAYMVRGWGTPDNPEQNTIVALHSIKGRDVPGNKLMDMEGKRTTVEKGDIIKVQGKSYRVYGATTLGKEAVSQDDKLWENHPGKLLLFTCLQRNAGYSVENVVIQASMVDDEGEPVFDTSYQNED